MAIELTLNTVPTAAQQEFIDCEATEVLYGGAVGGGKSIASVLKALQLCIQYPGLHVGLFRKSLQELRETLIKYCFEIYPKQIYKYRGIERKLTFLNNSYITFNYIDSDRDLVQYQGMEFDVLIIDEAVNLTPYQIKYIKSRLRTTRKDFQVRLYLLTNPIGISQSYLKVRYIDNKEPNIIYPTPEGNGQTLCYIPAKIYDNTYLMERDPGYVSRLNELPIEEKEALLNGDWSMASGLFFREWDPVLHVIPDYIPQPHDLLYMSMDFGTSSPSAIHWYAVSPCGSVKLYKELYTARSLHDYESGVNYNINEICTLIDSMTLPHEKIQYLVLDNSCWSDQGFGISIYEIMQKNLPGIPVIKSIKDRVNGLQQIRRYLTINPETGVPYFQSTEKCRFFTRIFPTMVHDPKKQGDIDKRLPAHGCDSLQYFLITRPQPKHMVTSTSPPHNSIANLKKIHKKT